MIRVQDLSTIPMYSLKGAMVNICQSTNRETLLPPLQFSFLYSGERDKQTVAKFIQIFRLNYRGKNINI